MVRIKGEEVRKKMRERNQKWTERTIDISNAKSWRMIEADDRNTDFTERCQLNESISGNKKDN